MAQRSCAPREAPGAAFSDSKRQPPEALRRDLAARGWSGASSDPVVGPETSHHRSPSTSVMAEHPLPADSGSVAEAVHLTLTLGMCLPGPGLPCRATFRDVVDRLAHRS
jgi:hypothetical protein